MAHADATTRLGQLQRGRGEGFRAALRDGAAAHDDLLQCVIEDPRIDRQIESRERYYAELLVKLDAPIEPIVEALVGESARLGHTVLAGAWRLGHEPARTLLASDDTDQGIIDGVAADLAGWNWATLVEMPPRATQAFLREILPLADCAVAARRVATETPFPGGMTIEDLLEFGRQMKADQRWAVVEELCRRGSEEDRLILEQTVSKDPVLGRARLAACALGTLGDERLLSMAMDYFGREDVFEDPARRLSGEDRMRRTVLNDYVCHFPIDRQLDLARGWHERGGYFATVAGSIFGDRATPDDRTRIEAFVEGNALLDGGFAIIAELEALGRIGDPRSAPLLLQVANEATYSQARRRAVQALAGMQQVDGVVDVLREALWDCEDETVEHAGAALSLRAEDRERLRALAANPLAELVQ